MANPDSTAIQERPIVLLQALIRFDTTNPPGDEGACVRYIQGLLEAAGIETTILARNAARPNLIARLKGRGEAPPLLLYGHVDVVTTRHQRWTHPPFAATIADGYLWGRGALDMKSGVAMMVAAFLRASAAPQQTAGDIVLAILCDEEAGGEYGAKYLVEKHPGQFEGVHYALGEFGGFSIYLGNQKFYPIQVAEKQICCLKATVRGPGGHGSMLMRGGTMAKAARLLAQLDRHKTPIHITPVFRLMVEHLVSASSFPRSLIFRQLQNPTLTRWVLRLLGDMGGSLEPLLRNTVNATMIQGGEIINVIPSEIAIGMDGRLLPGFKPEDLVAELRSIIGSEVALEVVHHDPGPPEPDMGLFDLLADILRGSDPDGIVIPLLLPGVTDGRFFARLGIQTYGFTPMKLPANFRLFEHIHAADERIPVEAVDFGAHAVYNVLQRYQI